MSEEQTITVREHLELRIKHEAELRLVEKASSELAIKLQSTEYGRRLDIIDIKLARVERELAMIAGGLALIAVLLKFVPAGFGLGQ